MHRTTNIDLLQPKFKELKGDKDSSRKGIFFYYLDLNGDFVHKMDENELDEMNGWR